MTKKEEALYERANALAERFETEYNEMFEAARITAKEPIALLSQPKFIELSKKLQGAPLQGQPALAPVERWKEARAKWHTLSEGERAAAVEESVKFFDRILTPVIERLRLDELSQPTFPEMKAIAIAIADGPTGRGWNQSIGEMAMVHSREGEPIQVRLRARPDISSVNDLLLELKAGGVQATLSCKAIVALVICNDGRIDTTLDELIRLVGRGDEARRSEETRAKVRREVWQTFQLFGNMDAIGRRAGVWRDRKTNKLIETDIIEPLIQVGYEIPSGTNLPPVRVSLRAGQWLERFIGNRRMLQEYGNILKLTQLPAGQPSGAWAQAIGLALNQLWREQSSYAEITRPGGDRQSVRFKPFTRRQLFDIFTPSLSPYELLSGDNPKRAIEYWNDAIKKLKPGIIGYYKELTPKIMPKSGLTAGAWRDKWLEQPLDIRPAEASQQDTIKIRTATSALKARAKRRATRKATKKTAE